MAIASSDAASDVVAVTPSDSVDLANACRAIRATGAGNIAVSTPGGGPTNAAIRTCAFAAGETRVIRATRIWSTGTTATGIEALI